MTQRADILNELRELTPMADQLSSATPYTCPEGYFDALPALVLRRVKAEETASAAEELEILSPLLSKLDRKTPYQVPESYFSELVPEIVSGAPITEQAKVIRPSFGARLMRYGMAASVAGIILVSGWWWWKQPADSGSVVVATQDIMNKVQKMSDLEMKAYLEGSTIAPVYTTMAATANIEPEDMRIMLADITDEELQHYAEQDDSVIPLLN